MFLSELKSNDGGYITELLVPGVQKRLLASLGFNRGVFISRELSSRSGNDIIYKVAETKVALRNETAEKIKISKAKPLSLRDFEKYDDFFISESSKLKSDKINIALIGNQNSGKSTLFNLITGSNQHIGNFPGVTVEKKTASLKNEKNIFVTDLPGIYSLSPVTCEEKVTLDFILREKPTGIINIIDASNLARGLFLTFQLLKLEIPVVIALNMMDEVKKSGEKIDCKKLENLIKTPVIPISASKNEGVDKLIKSSKDTFKNNIHHKYLSNFEKTKENSFLNENLNKIKKMLVSSKRTDISPAFAAEKIIEDQSEFFGLGTDKINGCKKIAKDIEKFYGQKAFDIIAEKRFDFSNYIISKVMKNLKSNSKPKKNADKFLCGSIFSFFIFSLIMALILFATFGSIGPFLQNLLLKCSQKANSEIAGFLSDLNVNKQIISLISDGILQGISAVLSFIPMILLILFFLALLEDSGYLARIAFIFDGITQKINLSGKSIVPLIMGFGCSVPAILASRTLSGENERKTTARLIPFMSCSAKLPVYIYLCKILNCKSKALIITLIYLLGIMLAVFFAALLSKKRFSGEREFFVLEMPKYRMPGFKNIFKSLFFKTKDFIIRVFTIILLMSIIFWFLKSYNTALKPCLPENSILAYFSGLISPLFAPIGLNDWRITASLFAGFAAKENLVSTLEILDFRTCLISVYTIAPLMIFCSLYTPCMAAIATQKKEFGIKSAVFTIVFQCSAAYIAALVLRTLLIIFL